MLNTTTTHPPFSVSFNTTHTQLTTDLRDPEGERSKKRGRGGGGKKSGKREEHRPNHIALPSYGQGPGYPVPAPRREHKNVEGWIFYRQCQVSELLPLEEW